jgi:hypothetical protein
VYCGGYNERIFSNAARPGEELEEDSSCGRQTRGEWRGYCTFPKVELRSLATSKSTCKMRLSLTIKLLLVEINMFPRRITGWRVWWL